LQTVFLCRATTNPGDEGGSFDDSGAFHGGVFFCDVNSEHGNPPANKHNSEPSPERAKEGHKNARNRVEEDKREEVKRQQQQQQHQQQQPPKQVSHVKPIIPQYGPDVTNLKKQAAKNEQNKDQQQINILPLILGEKNQGEKWSEKLVNEVVKDETNDNSSSSSAKEAFWFYLDPQGFEQGKFSSEQMLAWTKSGFFPHNLQVRRASENFFSDICQFAAIWEQAKPAQEPARTEVIYILSNPYPVLLTSNFLGTYVTISARLRCCNSS
jgi:GYF domain